MNPVPASREFVHAFLERADRDGVAPFDTFVDVALYAEVVGYYRKPRRRVGYGPGTDFFTATTSGAVFGELIVAAAVKLLGNGRAADHTFIEIGAEHPGGVLEGVSHPFAAARTIPLGGTLELAGPCVVFSNELFDAQPFRRFRFHDGRWRELGVACREGVLEEILLSSDPGESKSIALPPIAPEGYTVDAPVAAANLAGVIARQPWTGLFVAFDYGKSWRELIEACPAGTARAYFRHTQSNDLLAQPGDQDLTCHVCWDWLADALHRHGFTDPKVETQESFLIRHGEAYLAPAIAADAAQLTRRKQALLQLVHGAHLGQKFQVLHAVR